MEITQEKIEGWKAQHGDVYLIEVEDKACVVRKPNRKDLSFAMLLKDDPIKFNETLLNNLWIEGDAEIKTNDDYFLAVSSQLGELLQIKEATLKKL